MSANTRRPFFVLAVCALVLAQIACGKAAPIKSAPAVTPEPVNTSAPSPVLALIKSNPAAPAPVYRCIRPGENWNLRREPDETAKILGVLTGRDKVEIVAGGDWAKVKVLTGSAVNTIGFVNAKGLEACE